MPGDFITDDLDTFFETSEFAIDAVYTPSGGEATDVVVIFDDYNVNINPYTGEINNTFDGVIFGKYSDFENARHKDTIVIDGTTYELLPRPSSTSNAMIEIGVKRQ